MKLNPRILLPTLFALFFVSCVGTPTPAPEPTSALIVDRSTASIVRYPEPADYRDINRYSSAPKYDPDSQEQWQVDLRSSDLTGLDLSGSLADLMFADFDSQTLWPAQDHMPAGFDWQAIMELGRDPGLGMRNLHQQGITGQGIGIAIIDQTLLVEHVEYKDRVRIYEETDDIVGSWLEAQMHGPAVASIAVGKTIGVAPEADLYFIATTMCSHGTYESIDFSCLAESVTRIVEINKGLPPGRKIRVLSISVGWGPNSKGYGEIMAAIQEAEEAGIFVISTSLNRTHDLNFHGLGREPLSDPGRFEAYVPGLWWAQDFYDGRPLDRTLLVPMDSRTTASPTGTRDYVFYREGGWSWCVPYLAGMYALAAQVKPDITPDEFWDTALETGRTTRLVHEGQEYSLGVMLDPQALIQTLQK
jgi:hypothetical protein